MDEIKRWESAHSIISKAAREGWNSLKFQISIREKSLIQGVLPITNVKLSDLSPSVREDSKSRLLFPKDVSHENLTPIEVLGDGNCFFRSISNSLFGSEGRHVECRVRCMIELVMNTSRYLRQDTYTDMSSNRADMHYVLETSISDEARVSDDMTKSLQNEILRSVKNGYYSSLIHLYASVNALNRRIVTIFPSIQNVTINREVHNQTVRPLPQTSQRNGPPLFIMWTHTSNTNLINWRPNHFVSCHEKSDSSQESTLEDPPLKKHKVSDDFPAHSNEPGDPDKDMPSKDPDEQEMPGVY
ncbi:hypothetical protein FSP39_002648 [Pinctada imbricata]|uniref:Vertnin n=1 Tax=Pinctada imbricata TaxID=66713 RepID=A0AA88XV61_PINIB|nr:hypothetical protein FSP39_002648 [Pinctada imbricata]